MLKGMHAEVHVTLLCNEVQKIQFSYMQIFLPHTNTCIWWPTCISINNVWQLLITCGTEAFCRGRWVGYRPQQTACAQTWPRCDQTSCRIRHAQASVSGRKWHAGCLKKKNWKWNNTVTSLRHPQLHRTLWLHLLTVFIHVGQINFITEQNQPLVHLYGRQHHSIRSTFVLTVLVECLQQQFWGGSTGKVQANHLSRRENNHLEHPNHCRK